MLSVNFKIRGAITNIQCSLRSPAQLRVGPRAAVQGAAERFPSRAHGEIRADREPGAGEEGRGGGEGRGHRSPGGDDRADEERARQRDPGGGEEVEGHNAAENRQSADEPRRGVERADEGVAEREEGELARVRSIGSYYG